MQAIGARAPLRAAIEGTIRSLQVDLVSASMVRALAAADVECLVLKGPVLARSLYADGSPRSYVDTDLLVRPDQLADAERVLTSLGFRKRLGDADTPGWRQAAHHWTRASDRANVDLHRTLTGVNSSEHELWQALAAGSEQIRVGGASARVPAPSGLALHLALHAAQHGARGGKHLEDLERGLALWPEEVWSEAAVLARRVVATEALATGLRLLPSGRELAHRLALPRQRSVETELLAGVPVEGALGFNDLVQARGAVAQMHIIARKLIPTRRFMRAWSPLAARGPLGMAAAYLWRPLWVVSRLLPGYRAWRRALTAAQQSAQPHAAPRRR